MEQDNITSLSLTDVEKLCRVCLRHDEGNRCIFPVERSKNAIDNIQDLPWKLGLYGGVEIFVNDGLPDRICDRCIIRVNAAHELREECRNADLKLRRLLGKVEKSQYILQMDKSTQTIDAPYWIKLEKDEMKNTDIVKGINTLESKYNLKSSTAHSNKMDDEISEVDVKEDVRTPSKENSSFKKDSCKSRRLSVFKRITSMENLRNSRERQRQHIKKNTVAKCDSMERDDNSENLKITYECAMCGRKYLSKKALDKHLRIHWNNDKLKCNICNEEFAQQNKFFEHRKSHARQSVRCKICERDFRKFDTMVRHLNIHKRANPKEVLEFLKEIRDKRKLNKMKNDETMQIESEIRDDEVLRGESNSRDELIDFCSELEAYQCSKCSKRYSTEKSLQRHQLIHEEKKFVCNVCNMKFYRLDRLKSHQDRYDHNDEQQMTEPLKLPDGKSAIKLINNWIREELDAEDTEGKSFPCSTCGKSYVTQKSLAKHTANMHEVQIPRIPLNISAGESTKLNERMKSYSCSECDKTFVKESKLQKHVRVHERSKEQEDINFKRFLCHICSKTFRQNTGLMFHMRTHTGYKPHVCKYCGRGFTSNSNCINHERTHTGDRPFICHFCSAAFAKSCTLKAHITTHTGEANYHCKTCGKSFRRLKYLKEHRFTHTGEKPYACKICGTAYSHSGSLFVHERKCKANYNNYQSAVAITQNSESFCPPIVTTVGSVLPAMPSSVHPSVFMTTQHSQNTVSSLGIQANNQVNKCYAENIPRLNEPEMLPLGNVQLSTDVAAPLRTFTIIGQMFHS